MLAGADLDVRTSHGRSVLSVAREAKELHCTASGRGTWARRVRRATSASP